MNHVKENFIKKASMVIFGSDLVIKNENGYVDPSTWAKITALAEKLYTELQLEVINSIRKMLD